MPFQIEVCVDNLESLKNAICGGATRIELCSSLALGGLTPSVGFMQKAAEISTVPVYAMIRPRQGDFLYDNDDMDAMLADISAAKKAGLQGVVFGVLNHRAEVDMVLGKRLMLASKGLEVTFHRAIDQCSNYQKAIEDIIELGCERVLTSGLANKAPQGVDVITQMVQQSEGRLTVMAGSGVSALNGVDIIKKTGVSELHLSGATTRTSKMAQVIDNAKMGADDVDDFQIPVTSRDKIQDLVIALKSLG
jgi:copper homeostasis protein